MNYFKVNKISKRIHISGVSVLTLISLVLLGSLITPILAMAQSIEPDLNRNIKLNLVPYTDNQNLRLSLIGLSSNASYTINGQTGNSSEGYYAFPHFDGQYLSLTTGLVNKVSQDQTRGEPQFTLGFNIIGENDNYTLSFINGRITEEGWIDNTYFQKIGANSTKLVNLPQIIEMKDDNYVSLEKITATLENDTIAKPISFNINLIRNSLP